MAETTRKIKKLLFSRAIVIALLLLAQIFMMLLFVLRLSRYFAAMYGVFVVISAVVALRIVNSDSNPAYKLAWIIPVLLVPLFGGMLYLLFGSDMLGPKIEQRLCSEQERSGLSGSQTEEAEKTVNQLPGQLKKQSDYLSGAGYPPYCRTKAKFLEIGERKFEEMLTALKSAERYILLEYFIIDEGYMWQSVLEILEQKAAQGVEVRVIYDGFGCLATLPDDYFKVLRQKGIHCMEFNPLIPVFTMFMNHRDHRKILVVDGKIGFMGGVNIADEYINRTHPLGHWKDAAVRLEGDAVWSLVVMFVSMWNAISKERCELERYRPQKTEIAPQEGIVQPYSDTPLDSELVGETVYLNMINRAERYVYICTPYLITDNELITALLMAAKSGVDVRIITPHIGDKWYVHAITRAGYAQLIAGGVKIYEYTPGFIHAKVFVSDDNTATVGTINLDYRSLYLHFECGVWFCGGSIPLDIKQDYLNTLEKCERITEKSDIMRCSGLKRLIRAVLRLFAPIM